MFSISSIYTESLGDSTINDQEILSEISALFLLQLSDSLDPGQTMSLSEMKSKSKCCLHSLRSSNPLHWQTAANGTACELPWVPAERVLSRINPRTKITMDISEVQFTALINLCIRFT